MRIWVEKHRKTWRIREDLGHCKVDLATGFATKTAAKAAKDVIRGERLTGTKLVPRGGAQLVSDFCVTWWADRVDTYTRIRTKDDTFGVMDRYIVRLLGRLTLDELCEPLVVQRWVNDLTAGRTKPKRGQAKALAPATVRNAHGLLFTMMRDAVNRYRLIRENPCVGTRLPDPVEGEMRFLTPAEADRLIATTPMHWKPLIIFLLATGCRWSEALGVRAQDLDVLGRKVRFVRKRIEDVRGHFHDEDPKSRAGRRTNSFPVRVAHVLVSFDALNDDRDRRVFTAPRGGDVRHRDFYPIWWAILEKADLLGLRVHDLRHTHVAWLIAAGVHISAISRRIGHKSVAVTDLVYGHLMEEVDARLIAGLTETMAVIDLGPDTYEWGGIGGETVDHDGGQQGTRGDDSPVPAGSRDPD